MGGASGRAAAARLRRATLATPNAGRGGRADRAAGDHRRGRRSGRPRSWSRAAPGRCWSRGAPRGGRRGGHRRAGDAGGACTIFAARVPGRRRGARGARWPPRSPSSSAAAPLWRRPCGSPVTGWRGRSRPPSTVGDERRRSGDADGASSAARARDGACGVRFVGSRPIGFVGIVVAHESLARDDAAGPDGRLPPVLWTPTQTTPLSGFMSPGPRRPSGRPCRRRGPPCARSRVTLRIGVARRLEDRAVVDGDLELPGRLGLKAQPQRAGARRRGAGSGRRSRRSCVGEGQRAGGAGVVVGHDQLARGPPAIGGRADAHAGDQRRQRDRRAADATPPRHVPAMTSSSAFRPRPDSRAGRPGHLC